MEGEFKLFAELTENELAEIEAKRKYWKTQIIDVNSLQGRRRQFLKTYIHQPLPFHIAVHILPALISKLECCDILNRNITSEWLTNRHSAFPTTDQSLYEDVDVFVLVKERILPRISALYGFNNNDLEILDLFLVKYSACNQTGLKDHTDGCILSFNILLNENSDFSGGGTNFPEYGKVVRSQRGDCVIHPGKILHGGFPITSGSRILLVGFVETARRGKFAKQNLFRF